MLDQFKKSSKIRALIDCDSFFASCELLKYPKYKDQPFCVASQKGIVLASNYIAKEYGVKTGTPIREAEKTLGKNFNYVSPNHQYYNSISQKIFTYIKDICGNIEQFSIDESFFDITNISKFYQLEHDQLIKKFKIAINRKVGIPVSIGAAPTKILAKILSGYAKPYGTIYIQDEDKIDNILKKLPLKKTPFLGTKLCEKLQYKCKTIYDFKKLDYYYVQKKLGGGVLKIWFELNLINARNFGKNEIPKMISRSLSFNPYFITNKDILWSELIKNFERCYKELINNNIKTRHIKIKLKTKDFESYKDHIYLKTFTNSKKILLNNIKNMFENIFVDGITYRTTGVYLSIFENDKYTTNSLFENNNQINKKLEKTIIKLNKKFGNGTIKMASNTQKKSNRILGIHKNIS